MSKTLSAYKFILFLGILSFVHGVHSPAWGQTRMEVMETDGQVEWAQVSPELGRLEAEEKITVRALMGFGRLPQPFVQLTMELRKKNADILSAGPKELADLIAQAESGTLETDPQPLRDLLNLMEHREYHEWVVLQPDTVLEVSDFDLFRGQGQVVLRDDTGQTQTIAPANTVISLSEPLAASDHTPDVSQENIQEEPVVAAERSADTEDPGSPEVAVQEENDPEEVPTSSEGETETPEVAIPELPRIWGEAPGISLFDLNTYDQSGYMDWARLGAVCPAPQAGQLVAGSVQTPYGLWAWVIRYDDQGFPLWSRMLGENYDLSVTGATPLGENNFLIAGSMNHDHPAFFLALDDQGQVLWSKTSAPNQAENEKDWIFALASSDKTALAAGRVAREDDTALAISLSPDGTINWRLEIKEGTEIHAAIADGQDWIVAGQGANFTPWAAKIDAQGTLIWHKNYGEEYGQISAMTLTEQGKILVAGKGEQKGSMWLKSLETSGEVSQEIQVDLKVNEVLVVESVQDMAVDKNGDIWLAGESVSADGWLAKIAPDGQTHWVHVYGREKEDALKAVLPTDNGALAVGRSITPDSMDVCALWVLTVDQSGQPIQAAPMTDQGQILADKVNSLMALTAEIPGPHNSMYLQQSKDETLRLALPFTVMTEGLPGFGELFTKVGHVIAYAKPVAGAANQWNITLEIPASMTAHGYSGVEVGALVTDQRTLSFDFDSEKNILLGFNALLENLRYIPTETKTLAGIQQTLGVQEPGEEIHPGSLNRLAANMKLEQNDQGHWGGPLTVDIEGWKQVDAEGKTLGEIGSIQIRSNYENLDFSTLQSIPSELEKFTAEDAPDQEALKNSINTWVQSLGTGQGELSLNDLTLRIDEPEDLLHLKNFTLKGVSLASKQNPLLRDISTEYSIQGLNVTVDGGQAQLDKASFDMRLDRFSLQNVMLAALDALFGLDKENNWKNMIDKALGELELGFSLEGLKAAIPEQEQVEIEQSSLRLALTGLDTPAVNLSLNYLHNGLAGIPMVPLEAMPKTVKIDTTLKNVPVAKLATDWRLLKDPNTIFALMTEYDSTFNINALGADLPIGGLRVNGQGHAKIMEEDTPPIGELEVTVLIRNLQDMVDFLAGTMGEEEAKDLKATAAIVAMAGIEDKEYEDGIVHHYDVKFNSMGQLLVNDKDLSALLFGAGGDNQDGGDSKQEIDSE